MATQPGKVELKGGGKDATENTEATGDTSPTDHIQVRIILGYISQEEQQIAQEVCTIISERLHSSLELGEGVALMIRIDQCSQGKACRRMFCGELGCGWVVLETKWSLWKDHTPLIPTHTKILRDSGVIGCGDLFDSNFGANALLHKLAPKMADLIVNAILDEKLPVQQVGWAGGARS